MTRHATVVISRAFNLRLWFAVGSFGTIAALGVLWALWTSQFLTSNLLDRESEVTQEFLESIVAVDGTDIFADFGDGGTPGPKTLDFSNHIINIPGTIRANIYAPSYRVLWSTEAQLRGKIYPVNDELRAAFSGRRVTEIEDITANAKEEHVALKKGGLLIEAYVPIRSEGGKGPVIGVVEFYKVPTALQEKIDQGRRTVWLGAAAAAILVFVTLFWIVQKGARLIESQQARLSRMQTFAAIGQMAGAVAHSLRNPMAGVRSSAELWRSELPEPQRPIADEIIREVDRMDGYVRDLLAYCQAGDRTSGTVDPLQLLNGIIAKSQGLYERNNITISLTDERRGGDLVQGDPALLEQAMTS